MKNKSWQKYAQNFGWPTIFLAVLIVMGFYVSSLWMAYYPEAWMWLGLWHTFLLYLGFSVAHEAAHGNIHGKHKHLKWVNSFFGWTFSLMFFVPYPIFRRIHMRHHGMTNNPEHDPDYWVAADKWWKVIFRCSTIFFHYFSNFGGAILGEPPKAFCSWKANIIAVIFFLSLVAVPYALGFGEAFVVLFFIPSFFASSLLAFVLDWLPHHPHGTEERFFDTRILLFPGLRFLFLNHNYHLIHHLYPKIPFYNYKACFEEMEDDLREKGVTITEPSKV